MNSTVKLYVNPIWNDLRNLQKNVSALSYDYLHHNHLDIGYIQGIGNSINPNAFTSGNVIFVGDNITVNSSLDGTRQYIHLIGNTGGSGAIGGTSIIPGDYLSSSLNGSTLYLSVTGLYPSANTSLITSNAVNTSVLTNLQYTSNTSNITTNAVNTSITSQWLTTAAPVTHTHNYAASVHTHDYQTTGAYLTTAALSNHTHDQYLNTSATSFFIGTPYTTHTHPYIASQSTSLFQYLSNTGNITSAALNTSVSTRFAGTGITTASKTGTDIAGTLNTNGLSLLIPKYLTNVTLETGGDGVNILAAGSQTANSTGTVLFSNSNGVSFGMGNNSIITASYTQSTHEHPYVNTSVSSNFLTTALATNYTSHTHNQYVNTSASSLFQLTANNSLLLGTAYTTHTHNQYVNTSISSQWLTTAALSNHTHDYQSTGNYLTTAALSNHTHSQYLTTAALSNHTHSQYLTTAALSNHTHSNLYIALGDSTKYATSYLSATFQTTGNYLTTAANSTHTHPQYVNTSASSLFQHTSATSAITANALNTSAVSSITVNAMNTSERVNYYYTSNNTFANSTHTHGNISLALSNLTGTTASASNGMTLSISALEGGTLSLINSNNVSFGTSISENITSVTASVGKVHFVNINGFSWTSSTAAGNTSYYLVTA